MSKAQRVSDLVKRHPAKVFGFVRVTVLARREVGTHDDVRAPMVTADRVPTEDHAARPGDVVDHDVSRPLLARLCVGHIGEGDQPIEAITKDSVPSGDRVVDRVELFIGRVRMRLDRNRQGCVVPPVARVVIAQDPSPSALDSGKLHVACWAEVGGLANAVPGTSANSKDTTTSASRRFTAPPLWTAQAATQTNDARLPTARTAKRN